MSTELEQDVVAYVETTQAALKKAEADLAELPTLRAKVAELEAAAKAHADRQEQAKILHKEAFDALVLHNRTHEVYREKAAAVFSDPVEAVNLIKKLADPANVLPTTPKPLGRTGQTKDATAASGAAPDGDRGFRLLGAKVPVGERPSDDAWFSGLAAATNGMRS